MKRFAHETILACLTLLLLLVPLIPLVSTQEGRRGPEIDRLRFVVIKSPDAQLIAMQTETVHVRSSSSVPMELGPPIMETNGGLIRTGDIEKLDADGFTITASPGFHICHIGFNLRPNRDYLTESIRCNPAAAECLSDVWFRKALFHLYAQDTICPTICGYTVTPVQSLVPPAQGGWVNPEVEKPAYSPTLAQAVLEDHGYTYDSGIGNWRMPGGDLVPHMELWTPTYEVAPTSAEHGARFIQELHDFGLTSVVHEPREFSPYMDDVDLGDFDMYMVSWSLGRFPDHLETMCHSDHDVADHPGDYNYPGCHDPTLDAAVRTIITSLDHEEKLAACYLAQDILYNETYPDAAFSYMQLYSRINFEAYHPDLWGIVNSPGYGSHNDWTELNICWQPGLERYEDGDTIIEWILGEEPELLNPCSASTAYAWDIIDKTLDSLIAVNPYAHEDIPWLANDWEVDVWPDAGGPGVDWMNVTFFLNTTVTFQDGYAFTADDAAFSWLFLRDWQVPRYRGMTMYLEDVEVLDPYTVRAIMNTTSQFLIYRLAETAAQLPPQVWDRPWTSLEEIMYFDPTVGYSVAPGYTPGPTPPPTNLFGTGPFIFEFYDPIGMVADVVQNPDYFKATDEIHNQKVEMFHRIGDINRDGYIDVFDTVQMWVSYGTNMSDPGYNPDCDLDGDGVINIFDVCANGGLVAHYNEQRTYPYPSGGGGGSSSSESGARARDSSLPVMAESQEATDAVMHVAPPEIMDYTLKTNDTFTVEIGIANVTDLLGYDFRLTFNSTLLNVTSVTPGDFFGPAPHIWHENINNNAGFVRFALTPPCDPPTREGFSGSGRLATINFTVQGYDNCSLRQTGFTKLSNSRGIGVNHLTLDGYFDNRNPGDITGPAGIPDGIVDIVDLSTLGLAYGQRLGWPDYDPRADINQDGIVDLRDLAVVCWHYGWEWDP